MASFKEKFFGKLSGAFGDYIGVIKGDDNFVMRKASNRKIDTSPEGIERRNRFLACIKASKKINSISNLRYFWKEAAGPKQSAYNYCIKKNYPYITGSGTVDGFSIVPDFGFAFSIDTYARDENGINLSLMQFSNPTLFNTEIEKNIEAYFIIELSDPEKVNNEKVHFFPRITEPQPLDLENPLSFNVSFEQSDNMIFSLYPTVKVHIAFCTLDDEGSPVQYSASLLQ